MPDPTQEIALAAAKPLAIKAVDALLRPLLATARIVADPLVDTFTNRFSEYLARQYVKHSHLPTIVFQVRRPLEDLYIPLTVSEIDNRREDEKIQRLKLDRYRSDFLPSIGKVLIIDDAGMGKTTVSRYLLIQATKNLATIPVFVELRHLSPDRKLLDFLLSELNPIGILSESNSFQIDKRQVLRLLEKGLFTFLLDGYDEITEKNREGVTIDIKAFIDTYAENKFLLTSRPEHALASFPAFKVFRIEPLTREEAFDLINKYDNHGERATRLIERLKDNSLQGVHEFLKNPLLTTLLYRAYDYKNQIPLKKPVFYRQVFDALYEWHDLTKDGYSTRTKACSLDADGFHKILRGIGFICCMRGRVEADTDEVLGWIREARTYAPELKFSESDFLEDAIKAVPVLRREGNSILWAHKSLAEYFGAQFIVTDSKVDQARICQYLAASRNLRSFHNLLDLLYDMDVAIFSQHFIKPLLNLYEQEAKTIKAKFPGLSTTATSARAAATLGRRVAIYNSALPGNFPKKMELFASTAAVEWGLAPSVEVSEPFHQFIGVELRHFKNSNRQGIERVLSFVHPLRTIFDILVDKKHSLVLPHQFYPPSRTRARIVGARSSPTYVDNSPNQSWNSSKNFDQTTRALMDRSLAILNTDRVEVTLRDIAQSSQQSTTTSSLLESLK